jgi:hypothetical protein
MQLELAAEITASAGPEHHRSFIHFRADCPQIITPSGRFTLRRADLMPIEMDETKDGYVNANCRSQRIFKLGSSMQNPDMPEPAERSAGVQ